MECFREHELELYEQLQMSCQLGVLLDGEVAPGQKQLSDHFLYIIKCSVLELVETEQVLGLASLPSY